MGWTFHQSFMNKSASQCTEHTASVLASGQPSFSMMEIPESMEVDVVSQPQTVGSCTETVHVGESYRHHCAAPAETNLHQYSQKWIQRSSSFPSPHKLTKITID